MTYYTIGTRQMLSGRAHMYTYRYSYTYMYVYDDKLMPKRGLSLDRTVTDGERSCR